jgi:hypothetical protein
MTRSTGRISATITSALIILLVAACSGGAASPSPSVGPTGSPDAGSSSTPTPGQTSGTGSTRVELATATGNIVTLDVNDASATVIEALSGTPGDGASVEPYTVGVSNDDPTTLRLTWVGGPCDAQDSLTIDATARQFLLVQPECSGDAVAHDRILILRFSQPIDAAKIQAILQDGTDS